MNDVIDRTGDEVVTEEMTGRARDRMSAVRDLRLAGFPRRLDDPYAVMGGAIALQALLHAFNVLCEAFARGAITPDVEGARSVLGHAYLASFFVFALAIPVGCFFWMRWLDWSVKNRLVASEGRFGRTPAGVVWAYFIPVLNLFKPLTDLQRLWRAESRFGGEAPFVLTAWWVVTLAHLGTMAFALLMAGVTILTPASSALGVLSNLLALAVLRVFWQVQRNAGPAREQVAADDGIAAAQGAPA